MKSLKSYIIITVLTLSAALAANAQNANNIPAAVTNSFNAKYPNAKVNAWEADGDTFIARASINNKKSFAAFKVDGSWISTTSKVTWPGQLPAPVKSAYKNTQYYSWHVYSMSKIERPSGEFYRLVLDDANRTASFDNQSVLFDSILLDFRSDGKLTDSKGISEPLVYASGFKQGL